MNRPAWLTPHVPTAGPFGGPVASSSAVTFPLVGGEFAAITAGTFLIPEELSS
jgi:hypothetical protein